MIPVLMLPITSRAGVANDSEIVSGDMGRKLDAYMTRLQGVGFSGAALVAREGQILLQKGYGWADREAKRPVTPATVFTVGSITKQFTGAAILKLEMLGRLNTDDPITKFFDGVPEKQRGITLHHLLTHTAGFPGAIGDDFDLSADADRFLEQALGTKLLSEPGERYRYSNVGFSLLGIIVERSSGMGYEEFLRQHLFEPAGMTRTGYLLPRYDDEELAIGYRDGRRWNSVIRQPMLSDGPSWHLRANGGIHSTIGDMYRWHLALEGGDILSPEAKEKYYSPFADEGGGESFYGYGWSIVPDYMGTRLITHNGGNGIFSADFRRFVDAGIVIYTASNLSEFSPVDHVSRDLSRLVFGMDVDMPPETVELEGAVLDGFSGTYRLGSGAAIEARREGTHLLLTAAGAEARHLLAGGSGGADGTMIERLKEKSEEILRRAYRGDFTGIHAAFGGEMPLERVEAEEARWMEMRKQRYGEFEALEAVAAIRDGGRVSVYVRIDYERGSGYVRYEWEGGRLVGVKLVRGVPGTETRVYPLSRTAFGSFSLRSPARIRVEFELDEDSGTPAALVFHTGSGEIRAQRPR